MEKRLLNIFKITNVSKLIKAVLKISYTVLEINSKWKTLKEPAYFLRAVEFWLIFDIKISIALDIFWQKLQIYTF